ncbi:response regulator [Paraburkholderia sp. DHOC27]|uniref:hybrid sensor histidine kinase/response regulator n=1 Tax=Paraburkholderia sp. DHOC27 TaxID=2303330 RepID=UPI000E3D006B|nr:response regulator [Paraburkholderia sp. DHOC27]RFU44929.1 response regulator [Paraburkholderia sp. DHOC27]
MPFTALDHGCAGWKGEMAGRVRAFDWSPTELGPIVQWQQSLVAAVQFVLASPVPLVMLWGQQGYMVYNDAYAVFAGGRHPYLLGSPVELGWPEVAAFNRHVMDTCLAGGTLSYRDKELVLLRNGKPEDVWMDLYYSPVADDSGQPAGVLAIVVETTARVLTERWRHRAEATLRETNERLQLALNTGAVLGTWVWDIVDDTVTGDERFARAFSVSAEQAMQGVSRAVASEAIHPDDVALVERRTQEATETGKPFRVEYRIRRPHGEYLWVQANGQCEFDAHGAPYRFPGVLIDIHERKIAEQALRQLTETLEQRVADAVSARAVAEEQLRQAQKMEAIGSLTGGVAHDFNNVPQVISGNLQMLAADADQSPTSARRIAAASDAVKRGAQLAAHLLAFARRQPLSPAVANPARLLSGMSEMLHRALGETIHVDTILGAALWNVLVDRNQLENALLNLCINGRDAMRGEGTLTIRADNVTITEAYADDTTGLTAGDYLVFAITDSGVGMAADVLERALEPFFTTKPDGHGTGLGLSMVFGFVKQSGGHMQISSVVGSGTTVRLYFPRCDEAETVEFGDQRVAPLGGSETILIVEDDAQVRLTAVEMLAQLGYKVLTASDGDAALEFLNSGVPIDLLFTDVVMPGNIKSVELARRAALRTPPMPVLFTSGYTRDEIFHHGKLDSGVTLLSKPYHRDDLARTVRAVLHAHTHATARAAESEVDPTAQSSAFELAPTSADGEQHPRAAPAHVLLVEDDAPSREAMIELITSFGLTCTAAASAEEALSLAAGHRYDILLSDVTLPGLSGDALARMLLGAQPALRVVLMSGYGEQANIGAAIPGVRLLPKPFDIAVLRHVLTAVPERADTLAQCGHATS